MGDKSPEQLIIEMTAVQEAATEVRIKQLRVEEKRAGIEERRVAELQRIARKDAEITVCFKKINDILLNMTDMLNEIREMITGCSVRTVGDKKLDRLFNMLLWDLTAKKDMLSPEILRLLEIYKKDHKISVHTGTEIKSDGDMEMRTGDITGRDKQHFERSAW